MMATRLATRTLYAETAPYRYLRPRERIVGSVETDDYQTLWLIGHEWRKAIGRRKHDGRLGKRARR